MSVFDEDEYGGLDEALQSPGQESLIETNGNDTLDEAVARIEEANLWKILYSTEVFPAGSARDEIRIRLNEKLKSIALEEIQVLLGMRQTTRTSLFDSVESESQKTTLHALSGLDQAQVAALVKLANKVLQRVDNPTSTTQVAWTPQVTTIQATTLPVVPKINTVATAQTQKNVQQKPQVATPKKPRSKKGQTMPNGIKPIPPASAEVLLAQGAIKAPQVSMSGDAASGEMGRALGNLVQNLTQGNILHVDNNKSEEGDDINERF